MRIGERERLRPAVPECDAEATFCRKWRGAAAAHGKYTGIFDVGIDAPFEVPRTSVPLARDQRKLAEAPERVADVEAEAQPVGADGAVIAHHEHVLEERVQQRPELGGGLDCSAEVPRIERGRDFRIDAL